jgi:PD-(D/E)XK endonuclease
MATYPPMRAALSFDFPQKPGQTARVNFSHCYLVQLGLEVLLPWADHLGYDLAYYVVEEYRSFGFFVHQATHLVRIQVKTGRITKDGTCFEFNTVSVTTNTRGSNHRKRGYVGTEDRTGVSLMRKQLRVE